MPCKHAGEPTWLEKVSFVIDYAVDTCSTPWEVYLKTGGRALGNLAMTMLYVDMADMARSFLRPKGLRARRHAMPWLGRGGRRIKNGVFPEPSDLIANTTRSLTGLQKPTYSDGFNHIWKLDNHLQGLLNRVLFVNMATDFGYDWFSGILLNPKSNCDRGRFSCAYETGPYLDDGWQLPHRIGNPEFQKEATCFPGQVKIEEGLWAITYASRVTPLSAEPGTEVLFQLMVGDTEKMKSCGRVTKITRSENTPQVTKESWSVVKGPDFVRVISKKDHLDGGGHNGGCITILRGFRLD